MMMTVMIICDDDDRDDFDNDNNDTFQYVPLLGSHLPGFFIVITTGMSEGYTYYMYYTDRLKQFSL